MIWTQLESILESVAQPSVERVLNSLPEGLLIAIFAWLLLRIIGRQNAGTRFAVWITALLAVAALPFIAGFHSVIGQGHSLLPAGVAVPLFWIIPIFTLWAAGACIALARLATGLWQVRSIRRSCTVIDPAQFEGIQKAFAESGVSRPVIIAESGLVRVPAAVGFTRPMIVFPSWALHTLPPDELHVILIHELTHIRRRDDWTNLFQKLVRAIFFFHPAVWWIDARLSIEREMACDDAVLEKTGNPRAYASCLVSLLEKSCERRKWTMAQAAVHRAHEASLRVARILDPRRPATTRIWKLAPGLAGMFSIACIGVLLYTPRLIVFQPETTAAKTPAANFEYPAGGATEKARPAAVIPAAYRFDTPATAKHVAKKKKAPAVVPAASRSAITTAKPRTILASAKQQTHNAPSMLVLVSTTETETGTMISEATEETQTEISPRKPAQAESKDPNGTVWTIHILRLVWIAPAQAQQTSVKGSTI